MNYSVTYLLGGEREATHVVAPDAATAVVKVRELHARGPQFFELLCVVPVAEAATQPES